MTQNENVTVSEIFRDECEVGTKFDSEAACWREFYVYLKARKNGEFAAMINYPSGEIEDRLRTCLKTELKELSLSDQVWFGKFERDVYVIKEARDFIASIDGEPEPFLDVGSLPL